MKRSAMVSLVAAIAVICVLMASVGAAPAARSVSKCCTCQHTVAFKSGGGGATPASPSQPVEARLALGLNPKKTRVVARLLTSTGGKPYALVQKVALGPWTSASSNLTIASYAPDPSAANTNDATVTWTSNNKQHQVTLAATLTGLTITGRHTAAFRATAGRSSTKRGSFC